MSDNHSKEVRSYNMSRIKSTDSKPETIVRKFLFSKGLRYRKNVKNMCGKPDIVFPKYKTVVFVNGCFWHGHEGCKYFVMPKSNTEYWMPKISKNIDRDKNNYKQLSEEGWKIIIVWECQLKKDKLQRTLEELYLDIIGSK